MYLICLVLVVSFVLWKSWRRLWNKAETLNKKDVCRLDCESVVTYYFPGVKVMSLKRSIVSSVIIIVSSVVQWTSVITGQNDMCGRILHLSIHSVCLSDDCFSLTAFPWKCSWLSWTMKMCLSVYGFLYCVLLTIVLPCNFSGDWNAQFWSAALTITVFFS